MTSKQTFKNLAKATVLALCGLLSVNCSADELSLDISVAAYHWDREATAKYNFNEKNYGLGLRWTDGDYHKMIGAYKNSLNKTSAYTLLAWTPIRIADVRIGAVSGIVTGYAKPYNPAAGLYFAVPITKAINLNITAVPTVRSIKCYGFAGFQLSMKF